VAQPAAPPPEVAPLATPVATPAAPAEPRQARPERAERPAAEGSVEARSERPRRQREPRERREPREIEVSVTREVSATREVPITSEDDGDDGEAADRGPRRGKVFVTLGERDGADEAKVREAVAALAPGVELQGLELRRNHTYLFVAPEAVEAAVTALNGKEWQGRQLTAEKAKRRRR